ncbi:MAG TPA: hypothetical protein VFJ84_00410 [Candidatus Saccharimonadales bacterium]|nr:hypothetical protein [Candidatus Saccharimonadales bacterium]
MNPRGEAPMSFELPPQQPLTPEERGQQEQAAEAPPAAPERAANQPAQPVLPAVPDDIPAIPAADQPVIAAPPQDVIAPVPTDPKSLAQDSDRIEQEWLDKTKAVIQRTQDDPYLQKNQVSRIKAEYIQKRFNKTIKTDEAAA